MQVIKTVAAMGVLDVIAKTSTADRILEEATKRAEDTAEFLEKIEKEIEESKEN